MNETDFWEALEMRLCLEFNGIEDCRAAGLWCDGFIPMTFDILQSSLTISGDVWVGLGSPKNQKRWTFQLMVPPEAGTDRKTINWQRLIPDSESTDWINVDKDRGCIKMWPGNAH